MLLLITLFFPIPLLLLTILFLHLVLLAYLHRSANRVIFSKFEASELAALSKGVCGPSEGKYKEVQIHGPIRLQVCLP